MYLYPKEAQRVYYPHTHIATQIPSEKQKELKRREIKLDISCHNGRGEGRGWGGVGNQPFTRYMPQLQHFLHYLIIHTGVGARFASNFFTTIIYLINKRNHQKTHLTIYLYTSPDPVPESPTYPIT